MVCSGGGQWWPVDFGLGFTVVVGGWVTVAGGHGFAGLRRKKV